MKRLLKEHVLKGPGRAAPGGQPNKGCVRKEHYENRTVGG